MEQITPKNTERRCRAMSLLVETRTFVESSGVLGHTSLVHGQLVPHNLTIAIKLNSIESGSTAMKHFRQTAATSARKVSEEVGP